jgi:AraC-like DNA-binding protein
MEEVDEVARATGWRGEYRQLGKGPVTSRWRSLHLGEASLVSHRLDNRVHARIAPPEGCVALAIMSPPYRMLVEGTEFGDKQVLMANGEVEFVVPGEARCDTLVLPKPVFEASGQALFPQVPMVGRAACLIEGSSSRWSALQRNFENLLRAGSIGSEDLSHLLCRSFYLMAGETGERSRDVCLGNRSTSRVARLAQEYIEDHYSNSIRMEYLCRSTGVSLRTLERSFLRYFQVSPFEYIKARRLNAARQALVAGDPSCDRVTPIALDNGFTHLGRFSVDYREHFGESPKETLARRASSKLGQCRCTTTDVGHDAPPRSGGGRSASAES